MPKPENLNFDSPDRPVNPEQTLSELAPQPLVISRDELFFQAGIAAGSRRLADRIFWPSAIAALLLVSVGLGAAIVWQANSIGALRTELAAVEHNGTKTIAQSDSQVKSQADIERDVSDRFLADQRQRGWLRLASAGPLPPGRLTATGWEEMPREMGSGERGIEHQTQKQQPDSSAEPESAPQRPATYMELMRLQQEG